MMKTIVKGVFIICATTGVVLGMEQPTDHEKLLVKLGYAESGDARRMTETGTYNTANMAFNRGRRLNYSAPPAVATTATTTLTHMATTDDDRRRLMEKKNMTPGEIKRLEEIIDAGGKVEAVQNIKTDDHWIIPKGTYGQFVNLLGESISPNEWKVGYAIKFTSVEASQFGIRRKLVQVFRLPYPEDIFKVQPRYINEEANVSVPLIYRDNEAVLADLLKKEAELKEQFACDSDDSWDF